MVAYVGDVNAEYAACHIVAMFSLEGMRPRPLPVVGGDDDTAGLLPVAATQEEPAAPEGLLGVAGMTEGADSAIFELVDATAAADVVVPAAAEGEKNEKSAARSNLVQESARRKALHARDAETARRLFASANIRGMLGMRRS